MKDLTIFRFERLIDSKTRIRLYVCVAMFLFCIAWIAVFLRAHMLDRDINIIISDARGYYVYLPSVIIDGDLEFSNQIQAHKEPLLLEERGAESFALNKYPIGMALTLLPIFLVAHTLTLAAHALIGQAWLTPDGYSFLYQFLVVAGVMATGVATMTMIDRIIVRCFGVDSRIACAAILVYWSGSHYLYYFFREPLMVHIVSTFWVVLVIYLGEKVVSQIRWWHYPFLTFGLSMAVVCRPTNLAILAPVLAHQLHGIYRHRQSPKVMWGLPLSVFGLLPVFLQMLTWRMMVGQYLFYSYQNEGFNWTRPMLLSTLFSSRHGLFFWSPILLFAAWGGIWYTCRRGGTRNPLWQSLVIGGIFLWYLNSAWYEWWFGHAFGARAFLEISCLFVVSLAFCFEQLYTNGRRYIPLAIGCFAAGIFYNWILLALYITEKIPRGDPLL